MFRLKRIVALSCLTFLCLNGRAGTVCAQLALPFRGMRPTTTPVERPAEGVIGPGRELTQALVEAEELVDRGQFNEAVKLLQAVLDEPEDFFLSLDLRQCLKQKALDLIARMPPEGRQAYELLYGISARERLEDAAARDDAEGIADVMRRYFHTKAGYDATDRLASWEMDHGRPLAAAICFERLRASPGATAAREPMLSLKTALCWTRAGLPERSTEVLLALKSPGKISRLTVAGADVAFFQSSDQAQPWLQTIFPTASGSTVAHGDWTMFRGDPRRSADSAPVTAAGGDLWQFSTLDYLQLDSDSEINEAKIRAVRGEFQRERARFEAENQPTIPAAEPLIVGDVVLLRTLDGVTAINLKTGEFLWRSVLNEQSLTALLDQEGAMVDEENIERSLLSQFLAQRAWRNLASGTLSSDGRYVYAVEEVEFVTHYTLGIRAMRGSSMPEGNRLAAYEVRGGRFRWEAGGPRGEQQLALAGHFFLGPPLPSQGKLYCLATVGGEIRLLVLEPQPEKRSAKIVWTQSLIAPSPIPISAFSRSVSGLSPSLINGILICPTASGTTVAVDLTRRQLLWGYRYPPAVQNDFNDQRAIFMRMAGGPGLSIDESEERWLDSAPLITDGSVILTPQDSDELHCLNVADGGLIWKVPREQGLYLAGSYQGTVIVVGKDQVQCLRLADGKPAWQGPIPIERPSGRGLRDGRFYHLPLSTGEIATLDLDHGRIVSRSKLRNGHIPGNLVAAGGDPGFAVGRPGRGFPFASGTGAADRHRAGEECPRRSRTGPPWGTTAEPRGTGGRIGRPAEVAATGARAAHPRNSGRSDPGRHADRFRRLAEIRRRR